VTIVQPPDEAASTRSADVVLWLIEALVLIDAENAAVDRTFAFEILVRVTIDVDWRGLNERLVCVSA
jgi:hypothetical protein